MQRTVQSIVEQTQRFHARRREEFLATSRAVGNARAQLLLEYLADQETRAERLTDTVRQQCDPQILQRWVPYPPDQGMWPEELTVGAVDDPHSIVGQALEDARKACKLYGHLARETTEEGAKEIFSRMADAMEERMRAIASADTAVESF